MLSPKSKQQLKARAHALKPIVSVGNNGLTATVVNEVDRALTDHELIKVRIQGIDKEARKAILAEMCAETKAQSLQLIGNIGIIYRKNQDK